MHKIFTALLAGFTFLTFSAQSQTAPLCQDAAVHEQMVSSNQSYEQQGYKLHMMRQMPVPSGGYQPFTTTLKAGQSYMVNFFPMTDARGLKLTILDKNNKVVVSKKSKKNTVLSHTFVAKESEDYYIIVSQKMKKTKEICGGVTVLTK